MQFSLAPAVSRNWRPLKNKLPEGSQTPARSGSARRTRRRRRPRGEDSMFEGELKIVRNTLVQIEMLN
jgi:hypothetical protein